MKIYFFIPSRTD